MKYACFLIVFCTLISFSQLSIGSAQSDEMPVSIVMTFPVDFSELTDEIVRQSYQQISDAGIDISNVYYEWGMLETDQETYAWNELDYDLAVMADYGIQPSFELKIIDNNHVGSLPADMTFTRFDEPALIDRFKTFTLTLLDRYDGNISYLWIGNEIDSYLHENPDSLPGFITLYEETYRAIKEQYPAVKVGTISTYHDAAVNERLDVIETVGATGDLIGFSYYPEMMPGASPSDANAAFDEMAAIATRLNKKFAILESGWSTEGPNGSLERQTDFVNALFDAYAVHAESVEFVGWFILYDLSEATAQAVLAPYGIGPEYIDFVNFTASLGLGQIGGTMKASWEVFVERITRQDN